MTVRLRVRRGDWLAHVHDVAAATPALVPVVKGNGYGFGRAVLHPIAASLAADVAVGTVHELDHLAAGTTPVVLTPALAPPPTTNPILTVGALAHVAALAGWGGRVQVKLASSMHRYGAGPNELQAVLDAAHATGLEVTGASLHLALAGSEQERLAEVEAWLALLPPRLDLWLSHIAGDTYAAIARRHPRRGLRLRLGTQLWHGDKSFLHLDADVLDTHPVRAGTVAGYRHTPVSADGTIVLIGAGSAHGVAPLTDGGSPFHFARHRLALLEPPHMHTSMAFVPAGQPCPATGDVVDVQRPLIDTLVDDVVWLE